MFLICNLAGDDDSSSVDVHMDDSLLDVTETVTDSVNKSEKSSKTDHDDGKSADGEIPHLGEKRYH